MRAVGLVRSAAALGATLAALALGAWIAASTHAADLNQRSRMEAGDLGLPIDSLFKDKARREPFQYEPMGDGNPFFPGFSELSSRAAKTPAPPAEPPLGSALGGRRK